MDASGDLALGVRRLGAGFKLQGSGIQWLGVWGSFIKGVGFSIVCFGGHLGELEFGFLTFNWSFRDG